MMIEKAGGRRRTEEGRGDGWIDVRSGLRVRRADDTMMLWSFRRKMRIFMRSVGCSGCLPLLALCALLVLLVVRLAAHAGKKIICVAKVQSSTRIRWLRFVRRQIPSRALGSVPLSTDRRKLGIFGGKDEWFWREVYFHFVDRRSNSNPNIHQYAALNDISLSMRMMFFRFICTPHHLFYANEPRSIIFLSSGALT